MILRKAIHFLGLALALQICSAANLSAHEYYLLPQKFIAKPGEKLGVEHRLGQKFNGSQMPFIGRWTIRSERWDGDRITEIKGLDGDRPAMTYTHGDKGLERLIYQSTIDFLTFQTWEKFQSYVLKEGMPYALGPSERGEKPKKGLKEAYARYSKTLISSDGEPKGKDAATGLKIELIALEHPRALKNGQAMPVQLLFDGQPLPGAMVKVFVGIDTEAAHKITTNSKGIAQIPAEGIGPYLLNAIHMTEPEKGNDKLKDVHWQSYWASLTFERAE